jgi:N6-adenosine-specific RNA methylase IME4
MSIVEPIKQTLRTEVRPISSIKIKYRHRKELGDIAGLWESIKYDGLIHPPRIFEDGTVVGGIRRIEAFKYGGQTEMPFTVGDVGDIVSAEYAENGHRLDFSPRELFNITRELKEREESKARGRQGTRTDLGAICPDVGARTREKLAARGNISPRNFSKLERVFEAADADPETYGEIADELDRTRNVDKAYAQVVARQKQNRGKNRPPPPQGKYSVIVVDPAWPMGRIDLLVAPSADELDYDTMTEEEIRDFGQQYIVPIAADDCHLFLWTTQRFLPLALCLLAEWGFAYHFLMVWKKTTGMQPLGLPKYNCEFVVCGWNGTPKFTDTKDFACCFEGPSREHSRKPDKFYDTICRVTAGPRIDMFSRESREGFDQFGDQVKVFVEAVRTKLAIDLDDLDV